MVRAGVQKVRTGCRTCKYVNIVATSINALAGAPGTGYRTDETCRARKIKCDETRPRCNNCTRTGRECEGYSPPPPGSYSWDHLLCPRQPSLSPEGDSAELRGLDFFRHAVAPLLSTTLDTTFWTHRVPQILESEPAAKHAVLAISLLYENFQHGFLDSIVLSKSNTQRSKGRVSAVSHYNKAIRMVLATTFGDLEVLLIISLLFTCIEFLRGNEQAAIQHCRYGILVSNSSNVHFDVSALFSHLSVFPLFFGGTVDDFPMLKSAKTVSEYDSIQTVLEARQALDHLLTRTARLVRDADKYRLGLIRPDSSSNTPEQQHQQRILQELNSWIKPFNSLKRRVGQNSRKNSSCRLLEIQWLVCKIWTSACLDEKETVYDSYLADFERIVTVAKAETLARTLSSTKATKFTFEMGFAPLLHIVVLKCRHLSLRLEALQLLKNLASTRETIWDGNILPKIGARFIELEHGLQLDGSHGLGPTVFEEPHGLPPDHVRIRDSAHSRELDMAVDEQGVEKSRLRICLFFSNGQGGITEVWEWLHFEKIVEG